MTEPELAEIESTHWPCQLIGGTICGECKDYEPWPCGTARLVAEVRRLQALGSTGPLDAKIRTRLATALAIAVDDFDYDEGAYLKGCRLADMRALLTAYDALAGAEG